MITIHSERHRLHESQGELSGGQLRPGFETPQRVDQILARVRAVNLGEVLAPAPFGLAPVLRVHDEAFVRFLEDAWARWQALGRSHDALPQAWPARGMRQDQVPWHIDGQLGFYSSDNAAPLTAGTWPAACASVDVALTAQDRVARGARAAFALCRPPGHHAGAACMGGYCYLNNAAIAAQAFIDGGAARVAVLDVDYHHGNGTQGIFYERADVLFASIHGDPGFEYPHFLGYADERGAGAGLGFNHNYPLPAGSAWAVWGAALDQACERIAAFSPDALVVSLGVDTYEDDPISSFKLASPDYLRMGGRIAALGKPTLFVMEGGYAVGAIGINAVNVLQGFEGFEGVS